MPAILARAYHSLVGSSGPVSSASSVIGCGASFGIDAGRTQEQQLFHACLVRGMDDGGFDRQIVETGIRPASVVGDDAAHLGGGQQHASGLVGVQQADRAGARKSSLARSTVRTVQFSWQPAHQGGADHAAMAGHPDALAGSA